jgi:three-Cys-motif partner protein
MANEIFPIKDIGYWSEIKLDIIKKYANAYSTILTKQTGLKQIYIDAFAGTGIHRKKGSGELVPGSPLNAINVDPPFFEYHFIDTDEDKVKFLKNVVLKDRSVNAFVHEGDCNEILLNDLIPKIRYEDYKRALCFLDPYGLHLDWNVIKKAGEMRTFDIFLNFPILDMNRNVLLCDPASVAQKEIERMNRFWGDDSWKNETYSTQKDLFGEDTEIKGSVLGLIKAFRKRLKDVAGFSEVTEPIPMKNEQGGTLYFLYFASQKAVAAKIARDLFKKYRVAGL